jgi:TonB family protein
MASRRLHQESEQACDAMVLQLGVDGREYATHLLHIARALVPQDRLTPVLGFVRLSTIERRFAALLTPASQRTPTRRAMFAAVVALVMAALPIAAMTLPEMGVSVHLRTAGLPTLPDLVETHSADSAAAAIRDVRIAAAWPSRDLVGPHVFEYSVPPLYSDEARARRIEGTVTLEVRIDTSGRADVLRVVRGLGFGLDENARLALRHWQFSPATRHGVPVDTLAEVDIAFSLANEAINELIANDMATRVGPGVTPPRLVRRVAVSRESASTAAPGSVVLDVLLLEDGSPKVVRVVRSLDGTRDREAISAFEQWRFSPAMKEGRPVKVRLNAEVTFHPQ